MALCILWDIDEIDSFRFINEVNNQFYICKFLCFCVYFKDLDSYNLRTQNQRIYLIVYLVAIIKYNYVFFKFFNEKH